MPANARECPPSAHRKTPRMPRECPRVQIANSPFPCHTWRRPGGRSIGGPIGRAAGRMVRLSVESSIAQAVGRWVGRSTGLARGIGTMWSPQLYSDMSRPHSQNVRKLFSRTGWGAGYGLIGCSLNYSIHGTDDSIVRVAAATSLVLVSFTSEALCRSCDQSPWWRC